MTLKQKIKCVLGMHIFEYNEAREKCCKYCGRSAYAHLFDFYNANREQIERQLELAIFKRKQEEEKLRRIIREEVRDLW